MEHKVSIELLATLINNGTLQTCANCSHRADLATSWQQLNTVYCNEYEANPPTHIILKGCPAWDFSPPFEV